ncbi:unnamed protein product, partial [Oppiella nova]
VNNAGIGLFGRLDWGSLESIQNVFEVNVFGVLRVTRIFLPLIKQSKGRVVTMSSAAARLSQITCGAYSMSKASVHKFSEILRKEMIASNSGVNVSTICPGIYMSTNLTNAAISQMDRTWSETDQSIRDSYGDECFDRIKKILIKGTETTLVNWDPNAVINDIVDAIMNTRPKSLYISLDGLAMKLWFYCSLYLFDILRSHPSAIMAVNSGFKFTFSSDAVKQKTYAMCRRITPELLVDPNYWPHVAVFSRLEIASIDQLLLVPNITAPEVK